MRFGDLPVGSWFKHGSAVYIKTIEIGEVKCRAPSTFVAVSLVTGRAEFSAGMVDHCDVELIDKPDWAALAEQWDIKFDCPFDRARVENKIRDRFPTVEVRREDKDGSFFLTYLATPAVHAKIKTSVDES